MFNEKLVKKDGKLTHEKPGNKQLYDEFVKKLEEGQRLDVFFEVLGDGYTLGQLAKVHKCIRILAADTGHTVEEMKLEVKAKTGLYFKTTIDGQEYLVCRSFADCSSEELSLAIQAVIEIGDKVGTNLR